MKRKSKIGTKILISILIFGLSIIMIATVFVSIMCWIAQTADIYQEMESYLKSGAEYIDGDRIETYYRTGEKDAYYDSVQYYLKTQLQNSKLMYLYVIIPEEESYVYIWDAENNTDNAYLGKRETYESDQEKTAIRNAMNQDLQNSVLLSNTPEYKLIATLYYPLKNSSGTPTAVIGADLNADELKDIMGGLILINAIVIGAVTVVAALVYSGLSYVKLVRPIKMLNHAAKEVVSNLDDSKNAEPFRVDIHTGDELEDLADSFAQMDVDLKNHVRKLETVTREKEKISAELNVAAKIQSDMLPSIFPPFPEKKEFIIYASMNPAREVGGDFYDFFMIDDTHLGLVIADVSDKGVPAALFMVISKTLLKTRAEFGGTPKEILFDVNNQLCEGNEANLFVTVWMMILDITTGKGFAANAGHEYPIIRRDGGQFELLKDKHAMPMAVFPDLKFTEYEIDLRPGDSLFVYTDGAVEAMDADKNQFTTDRLTNALNTVKENDPKKMIDTATEAIDAFVQDAPQFDDTTMLALCYSGPDTAVTEEETRKQI